MTTAYARALALTKVARGRRTGRIDESWHMARGAFGGLLAAQLLVAMREDVADEERVARSLTLHFCAPTSGAFELATSIARVGSRVTHATAQVEGANGVTTLASASFGKDRPGAVRYATAQMPHVEPASAAQPLPAGIPGAPIFLQHVDARFCGPTRPFSSSADATIAAWVQLREPVAVDAAVAALLLDALPPAIAATLPAPRPLASVDFTVQLFSRFAPEARSSEPHLVAIRSRWADDGYTEELRELWSPAGDLVAQCRQLIALM